MTGVQTCALPISNWLIAFAVCLFVADVAMRRFQYVPKLNVLKPKKQKKAVSTPAPNTPEEVLTEPEHTAEDTVASQTHSKPKNMKKPKPPKKSKQTQQVLDTSQLLKKKDDRNLGGED